MANSKPHKLPLEQGSIEPRWYYGYYLIGAAFVAQFISLGVVSYVLAPFMLPMVDDLGWSRTAFSVPRTIGQVMMAFIGLFIGVYLDRYGGRRIMLLGTALLCSALFWLSGVQTLWGWYLGFGVVAMMGAAMLGPLVVNVTLAKWFVARRGQSVAWAAMGVSFAGIVIPATLTASIEVWGWRSTWQFLAVGCLLVLVPAALSMRRRPEDFGWNPDGRKGSDDNSAAAAREASDFAGSLNRSQAVRTPAFAMLAIAFGLYTSTIGVVLLHAIPYLQDSGFDPATSAIMISIASVPALISKPIWGYFIDHRPPRPLAAASSILTGLATLGILWAVQHDSHGLLIASFVCLGLGWGGMIPLQEVIWGLFFGRRYLGAVRGAAMPLALTLSAPAPLLAAIVVDSFGSYDSVWVAVAAANFLAAVLMATAPPPIKPDGSVT